MDRLADMVGTKEPYTMPKLSIAGRVYSRPASTCNLGNGKFCVLDNHLNQQDREAVLASLRQFVEPKAKAPRKSKKESIDES